MDEFLQIYGNCKSAQEYWDKKIDNKDSFYKSKTIKFNKNNFTHRLKAFKTELLAHNIIFTILEWKYSYASESYTIIKPAKQFIKSKYALKENVSFVFVTESEVHTALIDKGKISFSGYYAKPLDCVYILNSFIKVFGDMIDKPKDDTFEMLTFEKKAFSLGAIQLKK